MKAPRLLFLAILMSLLPLGVGGTGENPALVLEPPPLEVAVPEVTPTPEPNAAFLAGLGGLVLLFVVLRRK